MAGKARDVGQELARFDGNEASFLGSGREMVVKCCKHFFDGPPISTLLIFVEGGWYFKQIEMSISLMGQENRKVCKKIHTDLSNLATRLSLMLWVTCNMWFYLTAVRSQYGR